MADLVEVRVVGDGVAQVDAHGLPDLPRPGVAGLQQILDGLQALGVGHPHRQLDARGRGQAEHALLAEVECPGAAVATPLVHRGVGAVVHGGEGQLVEPAQQVAFGVHVARGLAGAQGDAEDPILAQAHGPGQSRDIPVVGDLQGHAQLGPDAQEDVADLAVAVLRNAPEEAGDADLVVHQDARGAAADGVHPGQVAGGGAQGLHDLAVVVGRVRVQAGRPHHLLAEDGLAVDDRADLAVGSAQVKADAAALQVAAQGLAELPRRGHLRRGAGQDLEGLAVDVPAHELAVEGPGPGGRVDRAQMVGDGRRPAHVGPAAAPLPQQELEEALDVGEVGREAGMALGEDHGLEARQGAIRPLQAQRQRHPPGGDRLGHEGPVRQHRWPEPGVQGGRRGWTHQVEAGTHGEAPEEGGGRHRIRLIMGPEAEGQILG